jgi:hypothetical protein
MEIRVPKPDWAENKSTIYIRGKAFTVDGSWAFGEIEEAVWDIWMLQLKAVKIIPEAERIERPITQTEYLQEHNTRKPGRPKK